MSTEQDKFKHSKRLQKQENAIHRQQAIALQHGVDKNLVDKSPVTGLPAVSRNACKTI